MAHQLAQSNCQAVTSRNNCYDPRKVGVVPLWTNDWVQQFPCKGLLHILDVLHDFSKLRQEDRDKNSTCFVVVNLMDTSELCSGCLESGVLLPEIRVWPTLIIPLVPRNLAFVRCLPVIGEIRDYPIRDYPIRATSNL